MDELKKTETPDERRRRHPALARSAHGGGPDSTLRQARDGEGPVRRCQSGPERLRSKLHTSSKRTPDERVRRGELELASRKACSKLTSSKRTPDERVR